MYSTVQKIFFATLFFSLGLLCVRPVFSIAGDVQLDVSTGGQIIGSALMTNKFTDAANTDYFLDPAASTTSLTVAGNVGIKTATPSAELDITGNINFTGKLLEDGVEVFSGMISAFAGDCPTGWTEYTAAAGRNIIGYTAGQTEFDTIGETGGEKTHTLTIAEMPSHTHIQDVHGHYINIPSYGGIVTSESTGAYGANYNRSQIGSSDPNYAWNAVGKIATNQYTGGSTAHNILQPYIALRYCQKSAGVDFAEWIPASENVSAATIVSIDPNNNEKIIASKKPYEQSVLGVISTKPGWIIGNQTEGSYQLALSGRVPTKVSLVNGEIKRGDPITTSSITGVGMKATSAGSIVGKAMEPLNDQSTLTDCVDSVTGKTEKCGTIVVFVNISWFDSDIRISNLIDTFAKLVVTTIQAELIETKKLIVDGVDILKKLTELSERSNKQQQTIENQQKQIEELQKTVEELKK